MQWTPDVSVGDWLRERLDDRWRGTMHEYVPREFPAYVRIFHPISREKPVGRPWPPLPFDRHRREWDAFEAAAPQIDAEPSSWAAAARVMGTTMHPLAQWTRLVAPGVIVENEDFPRDRDGWRYLPPQEGRLDPAVLATLAGILAAHTTTPDAAAIAVWEGWADLVGGMRVASTPGSALLPSHDFFNNPFQRPTWHPGILSDEISRGPRLELPNRGHVLFRGGINEFTDSSWPKRVPWADPRLAPQNAALANSPSIIWPDDHAWVMATEIDFDSTVVAGTADLAAAILADPRLEAVQIRAEADLSPSGDGVNR